MTWDKLARRIAGMTPEQRRKPVLCEFITNHEPTLYGVTVQDFETDFAVSFEIAEGDPVLKATN